MRVLLESPYAGTKEEIILHKTYARLCMRDCFKRNEYPFASHLLYTQPFILDDSIPGERSLGMAAGLDWGQFAEKTVVYTDLGLSDGMQYGIDDALNLEHEEGSRRDVEVRYLIEDNQSKRPKMISLHHKKSILYDILVSKPFGFGKI